MKKWLSVLLAAVMLLAMAGVAGAAVTTPTGTITVTNLEKWEIVELYQIIKMPFDTGKGQYDGVEWTDKVSGWSGLVGRTPEQAPSEDPKKSDEENKPARDFYQGMFKYIQSNQNIAPTAKNQLTSDEGTTLTFTGLEAGSYLVVIHGGAKIHQPYVASLKPVQGEDDTWSFDAAGASVNANTKYDLPKIDKEISTKNVGVTDEVEFTIEAEVPTYAENAEGVEYWIADIIDEAYDLVDNSLKVYSVKGEGESRKETELTASFNVNYNPTLDGVAAGKKSLFKIDFTYADIKAFDKVKVTYRAKVNDKIAVGASDNDNKASFRWGNASTRAYTYGLKVDKSDSRNKEKLNGVVFNLKGKEGNVLYFEKKGDVYHLIPAPKEEEKADAARLVTAGERENAGKIQIDGLAAGTYTLVEVEPLPEYNGIAPITVTLTVNETDLTKLANSNSSVLDAYFNVEITNGKGMTIPSTGGMGTTIFMVAGIGVMACAVVALMLVLKRQKHSEG